MSLIVKKFGGTSVADADKIKNVAKILAKEYENGNKVVCVVSAQGDFTDQLILKADEINKDPQKREVDMLLAAGEEISASLLSMAVSNLGYPVVSLLGWQAGFITDEIYGAARIKKIDITRIKSELNNNKIVIVAGFQGINKYGDITTLGRGGSDTSAVALAAVLHADLCQIYTDVDGVYTADPNKVENAKKLDRITYDEMLELASLGAKVLNSRSVELAKKFNVKIEVLSSFSQADGTIVEECAKMETMTISGVAKDDDISTVYIYGLHDAPGIAFKIFNALAKMNINADVILHTAESHGKTDIMFTVNNTDVSDTKKALESIKSIIDYENYEINGNVSKISVIGNGISSRPGIASKMFEALYNVGISIHMISSSESKISVIVEKGKADIALKAVHNAFVEQIL